MRVCVETEQTSWANWEKNCVIFSFLWLPSSVWVVCVCIFNGKVMIFRPYKWSGIIFTYCFRCGTLGFMYSDGLQHVARSIPIGFDWYVQKFTNKSFDAAPADTRPIHHSVCVCVCPCIGRCVAHSQAHTTCSFLHRLIKVSLFYLLLFLHFVWLLNKLLSILDGKCVARFGSDYFLRGLATEPHNTLLSSFNRTIHILQMNVCNFSLFISFVPKHRWMAAECVCVDLQIKQRHEKRIKNQLKCHMTI